MASEEFGGLTMVAVALLEWGGELGKTIRLEGDCNGADTLFEGEEDSINNRGE